MKYRHILHIENSITISIPFLAVAKSIFLHFYLHMKTVNMAELGESEWT